MGALNSLVSTLSLVRQGYDLVSGGLHSEAGYKEQEKAQQLALQQLRAQQLLREQQLSADNALAREKIAAESAAAEKERMSALRRAVARQRAAYGASGIASDEGSAEAVLLGMFAESEDDRRQREQLDELRNRVLDSNENQAQALNVLQYEQLKQRQKLDSASSSLSRADSAVDTVFGLADSLF